MARYKNGIIEGFAFPMPAFERARSASPAGFGLLDIPIATTMVWRQLNARTGLVIDEHVYSRGPLSS